MFTLLEFFGYHFTLELQQLNKRCYKVIVPMALHHVPVPKSVKSFMNMGENIDTEKVVCMFKKSIVISGMTG